MRAAVQAPVQHWYRQEGDGPLSSRRWSTACDDGPLLIGTEAELRARPQDPDATQCPRCIEHLAAAERIRAERLSKNTTTS